MTDNKVDEGYEKDWNIRGEECKIHNGIGKNIPTYRHLLITACHSDQSTSGYGKLHPDNIPFPSATVGILSGCQK